MHVVVKSQIAFLYNVLSDIAANRPIASSEAMPPSTEPDVWSKDSKDTRDGTTISFLTMATSSVPEWK
jgi:hypothetical protein